MIERIQAYKASDGTVFASMEDVQIHALNLLLTPEGEPTSVAVAALSKLVVSSRDKVLDILTTGPKALPKARAINGGTKKKKVAMLPIQAATEQPAPSTN